MSLRAIDHIVEDFKTRQPFQSVSGA